MKSKNRNRIAGKRYYPSQLNQIPLTLFGTNLESDFIRFLDQYVQDSDHRAPIRRSKPLRSEWD